MRFFFSPLKIIHDMSISSKSGKNMMNNKPEEEETIVMEKKTEAHSQTDNLVQVLKAGDCSYHLELS